MESSDILKKIQSGKATSEDIMLYISRTLKDTIDYSEKFTGLRQHAMNYFGENYLIPHIKKAVDIFNKVNNEEEVNKQDLDFYNEFKNDIYSQYQSEVQHSKQ